MPVSKDYADYVVEQLGRVEPIAVRRMFGGLGIYARGLFFALADDDVLFFKVDSETRAPFDAASAPPFQPYGPSGPAMEGYRELPGHVLDDIDQLGVWMKAAIGAASRSKGRKTSRRSRRDVDSTVSETGDVAAAVAKPTVKFTARPTVRPTAKPTVKPTARPTAKPMAMPSTKHGTNPTKRPR